MPDATSEGPGSLPTERLPGNFPLPRPDDDEAFTLGLVLEVGAVLNRHGYPYDVTNGEDYVRLLTHLHAFIYGD